MQNTKITNHQVFVITALFTCGSAILVISAAVASQAKQDSWISAILTLISGLFEIWLISILCSKYPGFSYIEILICIFGKWIGSFFAISLIGFFFSSVSQIIWYMGNFMTVQVMPGTPSFVINLLFFTAIAIAVLYGLEVFARSSEIFLYPISFLFILSMLFVLPNAKIENLLPVFENGIIPVLKGWILLSGFLIFPVAILLMVFPAHANNTIKAKMSLMKGYLWGQILVFISIIASILVLGSKITANSQFPIYMLAGNIRVGTILTRLEFIVAAVWIITLLTRGIIYFYAGVTGLVQLLNLRDYKKVVLPLGLILLVISEIVYTDVIYQADWDTYVWAPFAATFGLVLPVIMLIVSFFKKSKKGR